jgi:hypothetical protein
MEDYAKMNTPVECRVNMSKNDEGDKINSTTFKSLVGSLRYLTCNHPDIFFEVGLVSRFMKTSTMIHFKTLKRILQYIKCTIDFGLFYGYSDNFELIGYNDYDWAGYMNDKRSTMSFFSI